MTALPWTRFLPLFRTTFLVGISLVAEITIAAENNLLPADVDYPEIEVLGLFPGAAMLSVDGKQIYLKVGDSTAEGLRVNRASNEEVEIQFWNDVRTLKLSEKVSSNFREPEQTSVSISLNDSGQYMTFGVINSQSVKLLVDTGANIVALNGKMARDLLIDYKDGAQMFITTSAGVVKARKVVLDSIQLGGIRIDNVEAAVIPGDFPENILLGMSFLQSVQINERAGVLTLTGDL